MSALRDSLRGAADSCAEELSGGQFDELTQLGMRKKIRRGRAVRAARTTSLTAAAVVVTGVAAWGVVGHSDGPAPVGTPTSSPSPSVTTPTPTPTPTETPGIVLGDPIDEPGVPTYYAMPDGLLDTVGPGWVLATYAPRWSYDAGDAAPPSSELVLLVDPAGTLYLVARWDTGLATANGTATWTEHELGVWQPGELSVELRTVTHRLTYADGDQKVASADQSLDLRTGVLGDLGAEPKPGPEGLSPDGSLLLKSVDVGDFEWPATTLTRVADGALVATLAPSTPDGWCTPAAWWTADSLLAWCVDREPGGTPADGNVSYLELHPRLVVIAAEAWGMRPGTVVKHLAEGDPLPGWWGGSSTLADGVVAWEGDALRPDVSFWTIGMSGAYLQVGDQITELPSATQISPSCYRTRAVEGVVYVEAMGGGGDSAPGPHGLTAYDVATGTTTQLVGLPAGMTWPEDPLSGGLTSFAVYGDR